MSKQILMGRLTLALTLSLGLIGCQLTTGPAANTGRLAFHFQRAEAAPLSFQVQAIPPETERFEITVTGEGLSEALTASVSFSSGETESSHTMEGLPTGSKTVSVQAYSGSTVLAEASTEVEIEAGGTATAVLELAAVSMGQATLKLSPALPVPVEVKLEISGAGINGTQNKTLNFAADQTEAELGSLPAGEKQAKASFSAELAGRTVQSEPETLDFNVPAGGTATVKLSLAAAAELMIALGPEQLMELLENFDPEELEQLLADLEPVQLLALLGQVDQERLTDLFLNLPDDVQERLRDNPKLNQFVDFAEPVPSAEPSAEPSTEPSAEPTEAPVDLSELFLDVRFAMVAQTAVNLQLARPGKTAASDLGLIQTLDSDGANTLFRSAAWGVYVRSTYSGTETVDCTVKFTRDSDGEVIFHKDTFLGTRVTINERGFTGAAIAFNDGTVIPLDPGAYTLQVQLTHPDTGERVLKDYALNFVAPLGS